MSAKWSKVALPKSGARVTVMWLNSTSHERALVFGSARQKRVVSASTLVRLRHLDYGVTWCHGWTGRDVDNLKVVAGLSAHLG